MIYEFHTTSSAISVAVVTIAFLIYHFTSGSETLKHKIEVWFGENGKSFSTILFNRFLGLLVYGGLPLLVIVVVADFHFQDFGFRSLPGSDSWMWIAILSVVIIPMSFFNASNKVNLAMYPQIRIPVWNTSTIIISAITWILYLAAYEFMFRGFLLYALYDEMGMIAAIAINTSIYSLAHVNKGRAEALGAIPLGVLLCYLTLITGNILIAVSVHIVIALSNEWFSLRVHPEMKVVRK